MNFRPWTYRIPITDIYIRSVIPITRLPNVRWLIYLVEQLSVSIWERLVDLDIMQLEEAAQLESIKLGKLKMLKLSLTFRRAKFNSLVSYLALYSSYLATNSRRGLAGGLGQSHKTQTNLGLFSSADWTALSPRCKIPGAVQSRNKWGGKGHSPPPQKKKKNWKNFHCEIFAD